MRQLLILYDLGVGDLLNGLVGDKFKFQVWIYCEFLVLLFLEACGFPIEKGQVEVPNLFKVNVEGKLCHISIGLTVLHSFLNDYRLFELTSCYLHKWDGGIT